MNRLVILVVLSLILTTQVRCIRAQTAPIDPLSLHVNGTMVCRSLVDPTGVFLEFRDSIGLNMPRHSMLLFDRAGNPLTLTVNAEGKPSPGRNELHMIIAHFSPLLRGAYGVITIDTADPEPTQLVLPELPDPTLPDSVRTLPKGWRRATSEEVDRARNLAVDFWKRRCEKDELHAMPAVPPTTE